MHFERFIETILAKNGVLHETEVNTQSLAPEMFVNFVLLESHTWQHWALSNDFE